MSMTVLTKYVVFSNITVPPLPHSWNAWRIAGASSVVLAPLDFTTHICASTLFRESCLYDASNVPDT